MSEMARGCRTDQKVQVRNVLLESVEYFGPSDLELSLRHRPCAQVCRGHDVSPPPRICCDDYMRTVRPSRPQHWSLVLIVGFPDTVGAKEGQLTFFFFLKRGDGRRADLVKMSPS